MSSMTESSHVPSTRPGPGQGAYETDFEAPPGPPPYLEEDQLLHLVSQGWLTIPLADSVLNDLSTLSSEMSTFFDKPLNEKQSLYRPKLGTEFGFYHVANEKEYITLRCQIHPDSALEEKARLVWRNAATLLYRMLCDISRASGLAISVWDDILDGTQDVPRNAEDMTGTLLRLFRYYPGSGLAEKHTDLGLLTLCVGGKGLQVLDSRDGSWVDAEGRPTIVVGQTLRALASNRIRAGVHRVVETPGGRSSIVFALRHSYKHMIDLSRFGGGEHVDLIDPKKLWEQMKLGIININATVDIRQKQRAEFQLKKDMYIKENAIEIQEDEDKENGVNGQP